MSLDLKTMLNSNISQPSQPVQAFSWNINGYIMVTQSSLRKRTIKENECLVKSAVYIA